ncbi:hypothetical protein DAI22_01g456700 [Oryza sativa Japonica Group]|nr:hypothetical protein DAI22_01g456700 [Oryza sativa Japonica Group]
MLQLTSLHCGFAVLFLLGYLELQVALLINLFILPYGQRVASDGNATCLASALGCLPHRSRQGQAGCMESRAPGVGRRVGRR